MNITDYIVKEIPPFTLKNTVKKAQKVFKNHPISHFMVIQDAKLLGSFANEDIQIIEDKEDTLASFSHLLNLFFTTKKATVLELLKAFADNDTTIVPVINDQKNYIGYYDLRDVLHVFSNSPFLLEESETIIVQKVESDYSMSEVAQIVEVNGVKLLGAYVSKKTIDFIEITLKIASSEINEVIQTFRRYNYKVISNHKDDMYLEDLKSRSDYLQKYLEM